MGALPRRASCIGFGVADYEPVDPLGVLGSQQLGYGTPVVMSYDVGAVDAERIKEADHHRGLGR